MNYTKEQVIKEVQRDLKWAKEVQKKDQERGCSDLAYWSSIAKVEFLEANLKYLND
jgi:hypothetical protein